MWGAIGIILKSLPLFMEQIMKTIGWQWLNEEGKDLRRMMGTIIRTVIRS